MNRRRLMMTFKGMKEVEYITFTSESPRINTGLYLSEAEGAGACKFCDPDKAEKQYRLVTSLNDEDAHFEIYKNAILAVGYSAGGSWLNVGRSFNVSNTDNYVEITIDWYNKTGSAYNSGQNGVNKFNITKASEDVVGPIGFGGSGFADCRIYYIQFFKNGELVFDGVPVRIGEKGYFYDRISKQLFGDELIPGPDIIENALGE